MLKIECEAKELEQITKIARTFKQRTLLPATKLLTIETSKGEVLVKFSDLETMVIAKIDATVISSGKVRILPRVLSSFIKREKGKITIEEYKDKFTLCGDGTKLQLRMDRGEEFPVPMTGGYRLNLGTEFTRKLGWTWPYSSGEVSRPVLETVCMSNTEGLMEIAAADGFRLIKVELPPINPKYEADFRLNIPRKCCKLISHFMHGEVNMGFTEFEKVWFRTERLTIISQLVKGNFPQYNMLIPKGPPTWTVKVSAPLFQSRLLQYDSDAYIAQLFDSEGSLKIMMNDGGESSYEALLPAEIGGTGKIAINRDFLVSVCAIFSELEMQVTTVSQPMKIVGDLDKVVIVLMPMYIKWED